jgi:hypothetical protein
MRLRAPRRSVMLQFPLDPNLRVVLERVLADDASAARRRPISAVLV